MIRKTLTDFLRSERGNIAVTATLAAPVLIMLGGGALDVRRVEHQRADVQDALDAAVLAGIGADEDGDEAHAQEVFAANKAAAVPEGVFDLNAGELEGEVSYAVPTTFLKIIGVQTLPVTAYARAKIGNIANTCLLLTEPTNTALVVNSRATVTAQGCRVQVNSSHATAAVTASNATVTSGELCVVSGPTGVTRNPSSSINAPAKQCPVLADPFAEVPEPSVGGTCTDVIASGAGTTVRLTADRCYRNVTAQSGGKIVFESGVHKITGPVSVGADGTVEGSGVTLYFSGDNASLTGNSRATINLSAPATGPHVGFVIFQSRTGTASNNLIVNANVSGKIEGVAYMPRSELALNSNVTVGAAWSIIVAKKVTLNADSTLTVNSTFASGPPLPRPLRPIYLEA